MMSNPCGVIYRGLSALGQYQEKAEMLVPNRWQLTGRDELFRGVLPDSFQQVVAHSAVRLSDHDQRLIHKLRQQAEGITAHLVGANCLRCVQSPASGEDREPL